MLHAVVHNKKAQKRGNAWTLEDNVTSTFFGPLCFLPAKEVILLLSATFPSVKERITDKGYEHIEFEFWRRIKPGESSNRKGLIEPDLLIHFNKMEKSSRDDFLLLVEVKWQGYEDTNERHQVHEQIYAIKTHLKPESMHAIYLTQKDDKRPDANCQGVRICCVKWGGIAQRHRQLLEQASLGSQQWQATVVAYLEKMLETLFYGFKEERFTRLQQLKTLSNEEKVFFRL